jgi:S1-C subfamily serine protease
MTLLDWIIVVFAGLLAMFGFRRGFIVAVLSLCGFALGSFLGTRLGPLLLPRGSSSPYASAFGLIGALLAGAILAIGFEGVGLRLRRALILPDLDLLDGVLGAVLSAALGLAIAWVAAAVVIHASGTAQLRADVQRSAILRRLNDLLPPSGQVLGVLESLDPLPSIAGPLPSLAAPPKHVSRDPGVRAAARSVVRVVGTACGLSIEGSGWVAAPGVVVTNAHVVAGEQDTAVQVEGGEPALSARAVAFDPTDDVAVLRVGGLSLPALGFAEDTSTGRSGAVLGYPQDGPFRATPARIGSTRRVLADDAYGGGPVSRLLTPLRGVVRPGNSGGPLVDDEGHVLTTVFASTRGSPAGGYGVANQTVAALLSHLGARTIGTGPCTAG